jgi:hypothetical protein
MTATTTTATPSDVALLEEAVRGNPLDDAPRCALVDALQESGMTLTSAQWRACYVRGEGLARLIASNTSMAREARRKLRRTARCHPAQTGRLRRAVICVRWDRLLPEFHLASDTIRWHSTLFDKTTWTKDRIEVGTRFLLTVYL